MPAQDFQNQKFIDGVKANHKQTKYDDRKTDLQQILRLRHVFLADRRQEDNGRRTQACEQTQVESIGQGKGRKGPHDAPERHEKEEKCESESLRYNGHDAEQLKLPVHPKGGVQKRSQLGEHNHASRHLEPVLINAIIAERIRPPQKHSRASGQR